MNEAAIDAALLAYCKATGLNPKHSAVLREALRQSVSAYLKVDRNKHPAIIQGEKTLKELHEAMEPKQKPDAECL